MIQPHPGLNWGPRNQNPVCCHYTIGLSEWYHVLFSLERIFNFECLCFMATAFLTLLNLFISSTCIVEKL